MSTILPERLLKLLSKKDRESLGRGNMTSQEAADKYLSREEGKIHDLLTKELQRRDIYFIHASMHKRSTIKKGAPDFHVIHNGKAVAMEIKAPSGTVSDDQWKEIGHLKRTKTPVIVAYSFKQAMDFLKENLDIV